MPKQVDHHERREQIAAALMRVAATQGLAAVSLRHVAAEAGVTSGMVQHYFPTKDSMMDFAMRSAGARYEARMNDAIAGLGERPSARELVGALLMVLLPLDETQQADARVALAFQSYAATKLSAAEDLGGGNAELRSFLADQIRSAQSTGAAPGGVDPLHAATGLFAMAEGLGLQVLSAGLSTDAAIAALDAQLDITLGPPPR
ncbi:Transcriptional regulator, TetR family [Modestobacter italicus]|uniref:Transcriptional regulator, TetR family n=1 Tax=Modestobacter italicus (strain DSM 44449 / CECT 9708 / BC 501) TaxID=2732864 RepID=I4F563_MODI5|nr:TetR family transcriptional regulator C-terminal domain-containing protein [Modestobacter marinus]CCH90776.1 Transcriptional regulator, TetR family [Modestobacter marinus]